MTSILNTRFFSGKGKSIKNLIGCRKNKKKLNNIVVCKYGLKIQYINRCIHLNLCYRLDEPLV